MATKLSIVGYRSELNVPRHLTHLPLDVDGFVVLTREQFATHALALSSPSMLDELYSVVRLLDRAAVRPLQARLWVGSLWVGSYVGCKPVGMGRPGVMKSKLGVEFMLAAYENRWASLGRWVVVNPRGCFITTTVGWDAKTRKVRPLRKLSKLLPRCGLRS